MLAKRWQRGAADPEVVLTIVLGGLFLWWIVSVATFNYRMGVGAWGPEQTVRFTIQRFNTDNSGESSHYMVYATDGQVFEVDNGLWLGVNNADEIFGWMKQGGTYCATARGNKVLGRYPSQFFTLTQEYPYLTKVWAAPEGSGC